MAAMAQVGVIARRNLLHVTSDPQQLIGMTVQPLMFLLLFVYVFGGAIGGSARGYLQFVLPGLLIQGIGFWAMQTAVGLNVDFQRGLIDRFRSLPIARSAVVAGRITADLARTGWGTLITVGVGVAFGFRLHGGVAGCAAAFLLIMPLTFASSVFVPVATMPGWLQAFVRVNPVTVAADAARGLMLGGPVADPVLKAAAWIAGISIVFWALTLRRYRRRA